MRQGEGLRVLCKWRRRRRRRRWRMLLLLLLMCYMMMMTLADLCGRQMRVRVLILEHATCLGHSEHAGVCR